MFSKPSLIADNPLGIVIQSVERPSGDTTVYAYTPAGRLESEVREGQVAHSRYYGYNLDGSRAMVMRDDALNGSHWDVYSYDEVSGRLASVQDVWTGEANGFAWNLEGTLARWEEPNSYARVFGYDEEGRLVRIERDYGGGDVQLAYEYGYNSDGVRVWKRDGLAGQEYRYICRIGCGGVPMRVYNRAMSGGSWASVEDYLPAGNALGYNQNWQYRHTGGELLMMGATGEPSGYYPTDGNELLVQNQPPVACVCYLASGLEVCAPLGYGGCAGGRCEEVSSAVFLMVFGGCLAGGNGQGPCFENFYRSPNESYLICFGRCVAVCVPMAVGGRAAQRIIACALFCAIGCGITGGGFKLCFGLCFRACLGAMAGVRVPLILAVLAGCAWACTRVRD
jgi:hypothetical protein